jgi:uncharacterized protein YndB with AHSA1/START domain
MGRDATKPRSHEHEITIDAPIEAVWKALTDAEELTRWLSDKAQVTPGHGGRRWVAWGEGDPQEGGEIIDVWEPGKRLRLLMDPASLNTGPAATAGNLITVPIVQEYSLETREGKTVLRLVHSGIPDAEEWDGFYEGTRAGWPMFFIGLRHYLEKHAGKHRDTITLMEAISDGRQVAWNRLREASALEPEAGAHALEVGARYRATFATERRLEGRIEIFNPPKALVLTVENLSNSLLAVEFAEAQGTHFTYVALSTYGLGQSEIQGLREKWLGWLKEVFPAPDGGEKNSESEG